MSAPFADMAGFNVLERAGFLRSTKATPACSAQPSGQGRWAVLVGLIAVAAVALLRRRKSAHQA